MLAFAAQANARLIYVSTAFVHPRDGHTFNQYELSKRAAEVLIRQSEVPTTIVRPSIIIGDSRSGVSCKQQGIHRVIRLLLHDLLPAVPGAATSKLDLIPQDQVAEAIIGLLRHGVTGGDYWLTAGNAALSLDMGLELVAQQASRLLNKPVSKPRLVDPTAFGRLLGQTLLPTLPPVARQRVEASMSLFPFIHMANPFPSSFAQLRQQIGLPGLPDPQLTFQRNLDYIVRYTEARQG